MDTFEHHTNSRERLRDELLPHAGFYGLGLLWLLTMSAASEWSEGVGFALVAFTATVGIPITALVSLMMIWRMFKLGIDSGESYRW